MKKKDLVGKEFKWISPITSGETHGVIQKVLNSDDYPRIESTKNNCYHLNECTVKINGEFIKVFKIEN